MVRSAAGASMMNGSQRAPAKTRTPCPSPPAGSLTRKVTVSPAGVVHVPSCSKCRGPFGCTCGAKTQSNTSSSSPAVNGAPFPGAPAVSGRSRKR